MNSEETFRFLELYQAENCLWNPKNKNHKNKNIINDSWKRIADAMGIPVHELKKKKESLMTCFRHNLRKKTSCMKSGAGEEEAFKPIWQFYDVMEVFLKDVYDCKSICNSEENAQDNDNLRFDELYGGEGCSTTGLQNSDAGSSILESSLENSSPVNNLKVQKRRAKNPPELQDANKQMNAAFNTLNNVLKCKKNKEDKEEEDSDLFCKLLAKQLKDFPVEEREEIMYEIHGLILSKRRRLHGRVLQSSPSPSTYIYSPPSQSSAYTNETLYSSPSQIIINPSSRSSYITVRPPQNFNEETSFDSQFNKITNNKVTILSQETLPPGTNNILLEAFEKATMEKGE